MTEENLAVPFTTTVPGVEVDVIGIDLTRDGRVVARCTRGAVRQNIGVLDLPLPDPAPEASHWIEAYRHWARRNEQRARNAHTAICLLSWLTPRASR